MAAETIGFAIQPEDRSELDELVEYFGNGNRSQFLREALRVMAARKRAERLARVQQNMHDSIIAKHGRLPTSDEMNTLTRKLVKGK